MTTNEQKAELRKKVEFQVACEEKAYRIVERLIENPITQEFLHDALNFITPSHYSDIVEERAVSKLCGYPLCPNSLDKVLKQKYMISTKTNKVYDIEGRKNFCSGKCYKASLHVEKQVSSNPLWMRKSQPPTHFSFLPLDMPNGKVGEEVFLNMAEDLKEEIKTIEKMDEYQKQLSERKAKLDKKLESSTQGSSVKSYQTRKERTALSASDKDMKEGNGKRGGITMDQTAENMVDKLALDDGLMMVTSDVVQASIAATNQTDKSDINQMKSKSSPSSANKKLKGKSKGPNPQTEYLMKLLDKRKELLSKMADIQPSGVVSPADQSPCSSKAVDDKDHKDLDARVDDDNKSAKRLVSLVQKEEFKVSSNPDTSDGNNYKESSFVERQTADEHQGSKKAVTLESLTSENSDYTSQPQLARKTKTISPLEMIIDVVKSWMSKESLEYLNVEIVPCVDDDKSKFEKQYKELVAKVDAQEKDFESMIGEELMEDSQDTFKAPIPDFEQLKRDTEENLKKVNTFLRGTYKIKERNPAQDMSKTSSEILLPTLDKYNQMVIRRKIVMERISKVLPELLSSLKLVTQDVSTELRELVSTFNFTSENITLKPAEWTLITMVLLRLLCRKVHVLQRSFTSSSASSHFGLLLRAVQCDLSRMDELVDSLLQ